MCGIAGVIDGRRACDDASLGDTVRRMTDVLSHRGPDDHGTWVDVNPRVALGHRRLAVLDLSDAGHQPFHSQGDRFVLAYNGELYNHRALRADLERNGVRFRGTSDTEVLLEGIVRWGLDGALERANGMFAFALWDRTDRSLTLACDRMGEKPLYYGWHDGRFLFASELRSLRAHPASTGDVDRDVLALYLRHTHVPPPHCILRDTWKLAPGTTLRVRPDRLAERPQPKPYWSLLDVAVSGEQAPWTTPVPEALDHLDELLRDSVALRMEADVPHGALLSGGIDSSLVVALMQEQSSRPVRTFTIGFDDAAFDEAVHARAVARHLGTEHTEMYVQPRDALAVIPDLPRLYSEPFADSTQVATYLVAGLARREVTVCLAGDGGDELFGGYARYTSGSGALGLLGRVPPRLRHGVAGLLLRVPPRRWDEVVAVFADLRPGLLRQRRIGDKVHRLAEALSAPEGGDPYLRLMSHWQEPRVLVPDAVEPTTAFTSSATATAGLTPVGRMAYLDQAGYLPGDLLTKLDRATMAVSLEARVPLLDHRVVEAAWRWPADLKIRSGIGKWPLRTLLARRVPRSMVDRPKAGFSLPVGDWLRGPLRDWAESLLGADRLSAEGYLEPQEVHLAWSQHLSGARNRENELWAVLMFQAWLAASRQATAVAPLSSCTQAPTPRRSC